MEQLLIQDANSIRLNYRFMIIISILIGFILLTISININSSSSFFMWVELYMLRAWIFYSILVFFAWLLLKLENNPVRITINTVKGINSSRVIYFSIIFMNALLQSFY